MDELERTFREAPERARAFVVATGVYLAIAVVVNTIWMRTLYENDGLQRVVALFLFVVLPMYTQLVAWFS